MTRFHELASPASSRGTGLVLGRTYFDWLVPADFLSGRRGLRTLVAQDPLRARVARIQVEVSAFVPELASPFSQEIFANFSQNQSFFASILMKFRLFVFGKFGGRAKERAQSSGGCKVQRAKQRGGAK